MIVENESTRYFTLMYKVLCLNEQEYSCPQFCGDKIYTHTNPLFWGNIYQPLTHAHKLPLY